MGTMVSTMDSFSMSSVVSKATPAAPRMVPPTKIGNTQTCDPNGDEYLLIAVGNHQDRAAFNELFTRFSKKIYAMGMKLTRNDQLSHDLVQEAMLTVWQKAPLYDLDRGTAQSWIFTLTRNRCFDILRKMKRQPATVSADDIWPQEGDSDSQLVHEEEGTTEVAVSKIESFYTKLPAAQRAVIEQIYIHDRTHEEAAAVLEIPLGTLKSRLRLGVGKLRQMVGTDDD